MIDMRKFLLEIFVLVVLSCVGIALTYLVMICRGQKQVDSIYALSPGQDVLFIGSSQIGCGARRLPKYHHKLIWYMTSTFPTFEIHLRELERRNQLKGVKLIVVNLNTQSFQSMRREYFERCWHRALPLFWRYFDGYPTSYLSFVWYSLNHLGEVFQFAVSDTEADHAPITDKTDADLESFFKKTREDAKSRNYDGNISGWESVLRESIARFKAIAEHHGIEVVIVKMPVVSAMQNNLPDFDGQKLDEYVSYCKSIGYIYIDLGEFEDRFFIDSVHLSSAGSEEFMRRFYKKLELEVKFSSRGWDVLKGK